MWFYAPIDLILSETVVRQPDLVLIHRNRFSQIVKKRGIVRVPDLVVEIWYGFRFFMPTRELGTIKDN